ncbi:NLI interacting factor-like phosphatase-domain-containing protein [Pseudomassariella vexata]|uniref:NLI interacting factor-like phosphatase-domain-containing protein n=1 Tax=Pseudomassariella vexata TaxID=1141098 RepID=A0A1Y2DUZ3_9PEZI|nr:NLI interacting factor-like phosphatase-domain-containing protein [Pseudomassariella vexata]ORY63009.1 NLI interacting factor-like phosphatase-domain-containing protein [Pseudomassariella vexata]
MNSLNILSARVSPPSTPVASRSNSLSHVGLVSSADEENDQPGGGVYDGDKATTITAEPDEYHNSRDPEIADENTPLVEKSETKDANVRSSLWHVLPRRIANSFVNSLRWVLSTIAAPGVYLIACFYDERGNFAPLRQLRNLFGTYGADTRKFATEYHENVSHHDEKYGSTRRAGQGSRGKHGFTAMRPAVSSGSSSSGMSSESESDMTSRSDANSQRSGAAGRHTRSKSLQPAEEIAPARRSIRIKLHSDDALRQRKHRKSQSANVSAKGELSTPELSAQLKSPTSPAGALTRYPKTPAPPRPLIPRRQPSYIPYESGDPKHLKTLILDLDETLIHSMSKGGRMGSGHMVEVRLNTTYVGAGGQQSLGPQHPILYYVHKRPHCDEFLRKISKWYNLVIFTASVQEYADPVIDWLESERKFFTGRYYRQHCTFRHGAFIKDLSSVEPDLSKVMILDNSPLSYMFHQDNAIPIQGWISDPTDNDLLHLVPLLEGLQYVSDVRALLALRGGEDGT